MKPTHPNCAMIVAHGQPSDPAPAEADLRALAAAVSDHLPDWHITSATLAAQGSLSRAVTAPHGLVYPMFMAGGWFTATHLPDRLAQAGAANWRVLTPFGLDPQVQALAVSLALHATQGQTHRQVLLAAHGSFRSNAPSDVAYAMVGRLLTAGIDDAKAGFIDQSPRIAEVARGFGTDAICLPFFAANGGHVISDLPTALAEAGFLGRVLPPIGIDPQVPAIIAAALQTAANQTAANQTGVGQTAIA